MTDLADEPIAPALPESIPSSPDDSLSAHEQAFGPARREDTPDRARAESSSPPAETAEADAPPPETESTEIEEDRDPVTGRFLPRKKTPAERRAASHAAGPEDVPRINRLTAQLRAAEAERDALRAQARPTATPTTAPAPAPIPSKPKPTPDQFDDYSAFVDALVDWRTDQALTAAEAKRQAVDNERARTAEQQRIASSWSERVTAAKTKYPDFEQVALLTDTRIPQGSLIDAWILEHKAGAEILYELQKNPDELDRLLKLPLFDQAENLALLSQRFNGSSRRDAAATGSAPALSPTSVPKPPNPVRTGPQQSGDDPPDETHSSLYDHEKYYWQRNGARR